MDEVVRAQLSGKKISVVQHVPQFSEDGFFFKKKPSGCYLLSTFGSRRAPIAVFDALKLRRSAASVLGYIH